MITEDGDADEPAPPARAISFCADGGIVLVADLGASRTSVGAADLSGRLIDRRSSPTDLSGGPEPALAILERLLKQLLLDLPTDAPIRGIGIGVLGAVDSVSGRTLGDPLLAGWDRYPIRDRLASTFDVPVWVDNDVNMMAVGELKAGAARGQHNLIYLNMSERSALESSRTAGFIAVKAAPPARSATSRWSKNHPYRAGAEDKAASCASQVATSSPRPQHCLPARHGLLADLSPNTVTSQPTMLLTQLVR